MRKGPNPRIFMLMALAALFVGGGLSYFGWNTWSAASDNLKQLRAAQKDPKTLQSDLDKANAQLQASTVQLQHLEQGVPQFAYIPTMLTELEKTGKSCGIDVTGVRPIPKPPVARKEGDDTDNSPKRKAYEELDIEVKGRGSYRSVMNFIQALGKFPKIVAARTVELSPKNDPTQPAAMLEVTINLRAYAFPANTTQPKGGATAMAPGATHEG